MAVVVDRIFLLFGIKVEPKGGKEAEKSIDRIERRAARLGTALTAASAVMVGLGTAAYGAGAQVEKGLTRLQTHVGLTAKEADEARSKLRDLSRETGQGLSALVEGYFALRSSGIDAGQAFDIMRTSARAATAQFGSANDVAALLGRTLTIFGQDGLTAAQAADQFGLAIRKGYIASAGELATTLPMVMPLSQQLGVSFGETLAAVSSLTLTLPNAGQAVTGLSGILAELLNPTAMARDTFEQYGITLEEVKKRLRDGGGVIPTLQWLWEALEKNQEALGSVFQRKEALNSVLILAATNNQKYLDIQKEVNEASGIMAESFDIELTKATTNLSIAFNKLWLALENVWHQIAPVAVHLAKLPDWLLLVATGLIGLQAAAIVFSAGAGGGLIGWAIVLFKKLISLRTATDGATKATHGFRLATLWSSITTRVATAVQVAYRYTLLALFKAIRWLVTGIYSLIRAIVVKTAVTIKDIAASVVSRLATVASTIATWGLVAAKTALSARMWAVIIGTIAMAIAHGAMTVATVAATAATWLLAAALWALPIIGQIAAVFALIAVMYIFRDKIKKVFIDTLEWLRDNWMLVALIIGPFAWIVAAVWIFRDEILGAFTSLWVGTVAVFTAIKNFIVATVKFIGNAINDALGPVRWFLDKVGNLGDLWGWYWGIGDAMDRSQQSGGLVPVGAGAGGGGGGGSVAIGEINVNLENGDSTEISENVGSAIEENIRSLSSQNRSRVRR